MDPSSLLLPARFVPVHPDEAQDILGGAQASGFEGALDNISKISKVFNFMARIFSSTSSMLNSFLTVYKTIQQLNEYIENNF